MNRAIHFGGGGFNLNLAVSISQTARSDLCPSISPHVRALSQVAPAGEVVNKETSGAAADALRDL